MIRKVLRYSLISLGVLFFIAAVAIFRPVPIVTEDKAIVEQGLVKEIYGTKGNDIVFLFAHTKRRFYINRGLENNLEVEDLRNRLIGNTIVVKYPRYWTPLDWNDQIRHLSKVEFNGDIIFNELLPTRTKKAIY